MKHPLCNPFLVHRRLDSFLVIWTLLVFAGYTTSGVAAANAATFTDVSDEAGLNYVQWLPTPQNRTNGILHMTGGAAVGDVNNDGWIDLFVTRIDAPDLLYLNDGRGGFVDDSISRGFSQARDTNGPVFGDIDNDGDLDLYVTSVFDDRNYLYLNDGTGHFEERATERGADLRASGYLPTKFSATLGDYDNDGHLDLYNTEWGWINGEDTPAPTSRLLRNTGGGTFVDATASAGVDLSGGDIYTFSPRFTDLDRDGHVDLAIAADFQTSKLFWNNGDGTFTNGTRDAGVGTDENGMGSAVGDFDGDGLLDWFVTSIFDEVCGGCPPGRTGNRLFRNNGDRTFIDVTEQTGVRNAHWGWGTTFFDYDNDGDLDLAATNGVRFDGGGSLPFKNDPTVFFENDGAGNFSQVSADIGIADTESGKGLLVMDYDRDGDQDLLIVNNAGQPLLYRNDGGNDNHWLRVGTFGTDSNRDGLGAFIKVTPDADQPEIFMVREVNAGSNYLAHDEFTAHFGLGDREEAVDLVEITWPSGTLQVFADVSPDTLLVAKEPATLGDVNRDRQIDLADVASFNAAMVSGGVEIEFLRQVPEGNYYAGDTNLDGLVSPLDVDAFVAILAAETGLSPVEIRGLIVVPEPSSGTLIIFLTTLWFLRRSVVSFNPR